MSRVPPELINYENQMDDFLAESRRKNEKVGDLWADAHMRFHFHEQFPALPKKRFSWAGLIALLAVAFFVGCLVVWAVEAF